MANEKTALEVLEEVGAIIRSDHFVLNSGRHAREYVEKALLYPHTVPTSNLCADLAKFFLDDRIDVVAAPAIGGIPLSIWTANHLTNFLGREVLSVFAEREEEALLKLKADDHQMLIAIGRIDSERASQVLPGEELFIKKTTFKLMRGYGRLVVDKRVLVVEDTLTTGGSVREVVKAVRSAGGEVVAAGALCNRGNVMAEHLGVPILHSLVNLPLETWSEEGCERDGPCSEGIPINEMVGKGREYLERKLHAK